MADPRPAPVPRFQPPPVGSPEARIIQAAREHFFRLGFARCTMSDLARELGMSKKTLYQHFRSKEEIIDALIDMKAQEFAEGFDSIFALADVSFIERAFRVMHHGLATAGELTSAFLHDLRRSAPASFERFEAYRSEIAPRTWGRLLKEGIASGSVRSGVDPATTAQIILIAIQSLTRSESLEQLKLEPAEAIGRFFELIFAGLLTDSGRTEYENHATLET